MVGTPRFLVVEYDGAGLPFVDWAHARPGVRFDMILEPMKAEGTDLQLPAIALVRGLDAKGFRDLDDLLDEFYAPHSTLRRETQRGEWLGRITIHTMNMKSPAARAVARQAHQFSPPWSHVNEGVVYMRMRLEENTDAEALVAQLREDLKTAGAEAQVSLESYSSHDFSVWDRLVQTSIGLS